MRSTPKHANLVVTLGLILFASTGCGVAHGSGENFASSLALSASAIAIEPDLSANEPDLSHLAPCLEFDNEGTVIYHLPSAYKPNEPTRTSIDELGEKLRVVEEAHRDEISGMAKCTNYDGVAVFLATSSPALKAEMEAAAAGYPQYKLLFFQVPNSMPELLDRQSNLIESYEKLRKLGFNGSQPDIFTGGLVLYVDWDRTLDMAELKQELALWE